MRTLILTLLSALVLTVGCATTPSPDATTPQVHRFTSDAQGFDTHSHFVDTGDFIVVFGAQFTTPLAEAALAKIRAVTDHPIKYVVLTHPNPDKFNGASVFQREGAKLVASRETQAALKEVHAYKKYYFVKIAKMFTNETYPEAPMVDVVFDEEITLGEGDGRVELKVLEHSGVSSTQTVGFQPKTGALIVGDLIHHKAHAWLEGGIIEGQPRPDLTAWLAALEELRAYTGAVVYGGRGEVAPVAEAVDAQREYLIRVKAIIEAYVKEVGDTDALTGADAGTHHAAIAGRVAYAFPDHALSYMTEYSVYGLINTLATKLQAP